MSSKPLKTVKVEVYENNMFIVYVEMQKINKGLL